MSLSEQDATSNSEFYFEIADSLGLLSDTLLERDI